MPSSPIIQTDRLTDYASFSDESCCDSNHQFMIMGGVLCCSFSAHTISAEIAAIRNSTPFRESVQWKTMSRAKLPMAKRIMDLFLEHNAARRLDFNCIVFDQAKVDHARFNDNDPEKGFFKFLFQHYNKHRRTYGGGSAYRCFHGNRTTPYDMREMRRALNNTASLDSSFRVDPFKVVEFAEVRRTNLLQLSDLLIGAVGFDTHKKGDVRPDSPKAELAAYLRRECPVDSLARPTLGNDRGFSIWHFALGK